MWMTMVIVFDALQSFYGCQPEIACHISQQLQILQKSCGIGVLPNSVGYLVIVLLIFESNDFLTLGIMIAEENCQNKLNSKKYLN